MYPYGNSQCQRVKRFQTQRVNCQLFQVVICLNSWKYYHLIRSCCHYTVNNKPAVWLLAAGYNHAINRYSPTWFSPEWVQSRFAETRFAETLTLTLALNPNFGESAWFRRNGFRRIGKTPANIPPYGAVLWPTARIAIAANVPVLSLNVNVINLTRKKHIVAWKRANRDVNHATS